ncbi:MAG: FtsQ-type POTRA domain-containing protein [Anaerolineales bacterium]|nr:FtsQ-type POTRA domain-containing protein [Anaerolineales bacterium]
MTRAELVRQRRFQQQTAEMHLQPQVRSVLPVVKPAPVKKNGVASRPMARAKKRRRYEVAFSPANENLRPTAMPIIRLEWRAASALLLILLSVALYLGFASPYFMVAAPSVQGNQYLSAGEINSVLQLSGKSIFLLTPRQIERDLQITLPSLSSVSVSVRLPNQVSVIVTERQPVIVWQQLDGSMAWIDAQGIAVQPRAQMEGLFPVLALGRPPAPALDEISSDPLAPPPFISPEMITALQALSPYIPAGTQVIYDPQQGISWDDPLGWTVQLGDITEDTALKLRVYETMIGWFAQENIQPILVNVAYPRSPFFRMEQ